MSSPNPDDIPHRKVLYGRRHGRPLRKGRLEVLDNLLPACKLEAPKDDAKLDVAGLFDQPMRDLWFEVGFGGGEHLAWHAERNPDIGFIGCEPFINGVSSLLKHIEQGGQRNIRVVPDDARPILDALPDASVGRAFVLFPDPWPKARHAFRRFIGPDNLPRLARVLKDGAELRMASDDMQLARWMLEHTWRYADFEWMAEGPTDWRTRPEDWPATRYEQKMLTGCRPVFLRFRRRHRA